MKVIDIAKKNYPTYWSIDRLVALVKAEKLSESDYKEITGFDYPATAQEVTEWLEHCKSYNDGNMRVTAKSSSTRFPMCGSSQKIDFTNYSKIHYEIKTMSGYMQQITYFSKLLQAKQ